VRELFADEVQRGEELVRAHVGRGEEGEAVGELGIVEQRPGRVDRRDRRVDATAELQPLLRRLRAEDVPQLALELAVAAAWSAYLEPGQRSKRSARSTPSQKFLQKACSDAMKSTWR